MDYFIEANIKFKDDNPLSPEHLKTTITYLKSCTLTKWDYNDEAKTLTTKDISIFGNPTDLINDMFDSIIELHEASIKFYKLCLFVIDRQNPDLKITSEEE